MEVSQGSGVCAALCIWLTLRWHVTISTPMVIVAILTVFWLFLTVFDEWYTEPIAKTLKTIGVPILTGLPRQVYQRCTNRKKQPKTVKRRSKQEKWPLVYQSSQVYQDCTKNSQNSTKMTIGVPIVTGLPRLYQQCNKSLPIVNKNLVIANRASAAHTIRHS